MFLETPVTAWVLVCALVSGVLVIVSGLTVRAGGLQTIAKGRSSRVPWYRKMMGLGASGSEFRPPRTVGGNPIAWREATARNSTFWKIVARWAFVAGGILAGISITLGYAFDWFGAMTTDEFELVLLSVVWTEWAIITLVAVNMAATAVSREREDGTLDLLLTTPMTPGSYLGGKLRGLVAYLVPLLAVPVITVGAAGVYALVAGDDPKALLPAANGLPERPVVLPEAGLIAAVTLVVFTAFCVMIGLQWSLKSRGTIGSMVGTVGVIAVIGGIAGLCGWQFSSNVQAIGPAMAALNPATALFACIDPGEGMRETMEQSDGLIAARISLASGAVAALVVYVAVIYGIHASLVRGFDFTVRKLAGAR